MLWYKCEVVQIIWSPEWFCAFDIHLYIKTMICIYFCVLQLPVLTLRKAKYVWNMSLCSYYDLHFERSLLP